MTFYIPESYKKLKELMHRRTPQYSGECYMFTCPSCGGKKSVAKLFMQPGSCNVWSDWLDEEFSYRVLSTLQRCPHCGGYYIVTHEGAPTEVAIATDDGKIELEELEKFLCEERDLENVELANLYMQYVHMYNDCFRRNPIEGIKATYNQSKLFSDAVLFLTERCRIPQIVIADLYRQAGMFRKCMEYAADFVCRCNDEDKEILDKTRYLAIKGETEPFVMRSSTI